MSSAEGFVPGALWSLWELMHELRSGPFLKAYEQVATFHQFLTTVAGNGLNIEQDSHSVLIGQLNDLHEELTKVGLASSAVAVKRANDLLQTATMGEVLAGKQRVVLPAPDALKVQNWLAQATSRIADDFSLQCVVVIDSKHMHLYGNDKSFGDLVFKNFGSAVHDISEAANCLALGRGTACALHLFRAREVALAALAARVGVPKQIDWGKYINGIDDELQKRKKSSGARTPDEQFFAAMAIDFDDMRRAWRNPTMHPEKNYSVKEAERIFDTVGAFMDHLAKGGVQE